MESTLLSSTLPTTTFIAHSHWGHYHETDMPQSSSWVARHISRIVAVQIRACREEVNSVLDDVSTLEKWGESEWIYPHLATTAPELGPMMRAHTQNSARTWLCVPTPGFISCCLKVIRLRQCTQRIPDPKQRTKNWTINRHSGLS